MFVSPCSNSHSSFSERDLLNQNEVFTQLENIHESTEDKPTKPLMYFRFKPA
ncbi:uncharacterized protein BX663DRAFT_516656 [Cokeromyces recurvatus]|uniref:uncharacterized protein n=1 Tax=Cokeromyces recurvatus TaxID=90255 RepID=UPI00221E7361|nr:uncharacterized protein BX663DRAFT_516656 [Cokeromyces recurvatus]KAI7900830.1 hypothetical protein BX663DRAFT_516656 [Cokeromyces recurvatus]